MSQTSFFGENLNLNGVAAHTSFEPVPAGWYTGVPESIDVTRKDWGMSAKVKIKLTSPAAYAGRVVFDNLVLTHCNSEKAQKIGQQRLASWCDAVGVDRNLSSMDPFIGREVAMKIRVDAPRTVGDRTYDASNRVEAFATATGEVAAAPVTRPALVSTTASVTTASPVAAQGNGARNPMPWQRQ